MDGLKFKVLLIEDDEVDQKTFIRMVREEELDYDCTITGSVSQAKEKLGKEEFDIVVADYMLGDGTAFDILEAAGERDIPVVIVTGAGGEEIVVKAWKAGVYDYLIKDKQGNYLKTLPVTVENAVKHSRIEKQLLLLSFAMTGTDDCVYITDLQGEIIFVNRSFCETYGYDEEEVIGMEHKVLWQGTSDSESDNACQPVSGWETGYYHKRKNGELFPVSVHESVIRNENGSEVAHLGVARDISEKVFFEEKLRAINLELKHGNRRIDSLS
jgi:PAS domain S-box-containing protein